MKSIINFLILLLVIAAIGFLVWFAVDKSLFGDAEQQIPPQEELVLPAAPPPVTATSPQEISPEEAFGATASSDDTKASKTSCSKAAETIGVIYDMHMEGKSTEAITQYLAGLDEFTQDDIEMFSQITDSIKSAPSDQLLSRQAMMEQFKQQCEAADTN